MLFHGYNETYSRDDILRDLGMQSVGNKFMDDDGKELTTESYFAEYIPAKMINSRKVLLGSLQDGLTIGGCPLKSNALENGCGLASDILSSVPMEAIQKIFFSKPSFSAEDLIAVILPEYGNAGSIYCVNLSCFLLLI